MRHFVNPTPQDKTQKFKTVSPIGYCFCLTFKHKARIELTDISRPTSELITAVKSFMSLTAGQKSCGNETSFVLRTSYDHYLGRVAVSQNLSRLIKLTF
jgi:hypothetical protein